MRLLQVIAKSSLALAAMIASATIATAQNFNLTKYTTGQGLPQNYVYDIAQTPDGFVWIATGEGLTRFDGLNFINYTTRDSLNEMFCSKLLVDLEGALWIGHGNGQLTFAKNGVLKKIFIDEAQAPIKDMDIDERGNIWVIEQNKGIVRISADGEVTPLFNRKLMGRRIYYSIKAINAYTLLLGTSNGLILVKLDTNGNLEAPRAIEGMEDISVTAISKARKKGSYYCSTDDGNLYHYNINEGAEMIVRCDGSCSPDANVDHIEIKSVYEDEEGALYLATWGAGLLKWEYSPQRKQYIQTLHINDTNGGETNYINQITRCREGILWLATYGAGVEAWINNYFAFYNLKEIGFNRFKATTVFPYKNNLYIGLNNGILRMDKLCASNIDYWGSEIGLPANQAITSILVDSVSGTLYAGTEQSGIYYKRPNTMWFNKLNYNNGSGTINMVTGMLISNDTLYIATQGGLVSYNKNTHESTIYTTADGLPHNNINFIYLDEGGSLWLGPKDSGIARFTADGFELARLSDEAVNITGMTTDLQGRMWLSTATKGVICQNGDSILSLSKSDGLLKNYCHSISSDATGRIWVAHQPGLSCIDLNTGNMRTFDQSNGMEYDFKEAIKDRNGEIWFCSSEGITRYVTSYDKRNIVPPVINRTYTLISGVAHSNNEAIDLDYPYFREPDKLEFGFIGICMRDPNNVYYEYQLVADGEDGNKWMKLGTINHKEFDLLPPGNYSFNVRAYNPDGTMAKRELHIPIKIALPFWQQTWFWILIAIGLYLAIRYFVRWREKKLQERQHELEEEVNKKTAQLQKQKSIIERKNRDIMDGINYANRIQTAILPSPASMETLPIDSSFLLFRPRDVVSGDLYWHEQIGDDLFVFCGDCTGHGVPGAFMCMIVTTILNEEARSHTSNSPAAILNRLDREIKQTLNKNQSVENQDGLDCAIVMINLKTLVMTSAAARRPIEILQKGKLNGIKGTRRSIGERRNGNEFVETTTQLNKGDIIYMFSDGYTDQFNPSEEKYTTGRLKRRICEIADEPMAEQKRLLEQDFDEYKQDHYQIDDVIVMGLKI